MKVVSFFFILYKDCLVFNIMLKRCISLCAILSACPIQCIVKINGHCISTHDGSCIASYNYPEPYENSVGCYIQGVPKLPLVVNAFGTEPTNDYLTIDNVTYSGDHGPVGVVSKSGQVFWYTNVNVTGAGWELCWGRSLPPVATPSLQRPPPPPPSPSPPPPPSPSPPPPRPPPPPSPSPPPSI